LKKVVETEIIIYHSYAFKPVWLIKCPYCKQILRPFVGENSKEAYLQCINCGYAIKLSDQPPVWVCSNF